MSSVAEKPQVEALFREIVKAELAPVYELLAQMLDGAQALVEGQRRLEAEIIHRRQLDELRRRFEEKYFDVPAALAILEPLRDPELATDRRYVSKTFHELGRRKAGAKTKGTTIAKLVRAMGLDPVDVDEDLQAAEVAR
jgi:hypothetical protein